MVPQPAEDIHARAARLEFELSQFRDHFPDAMVEVHIPSLRVTYMSKLARAVLGYSEEEVEQGLFAPQLLDAASLADAAMHLSSDMAESETRGYSRKPGQHIRHYVGVRKDGSTFPAELQTAYILDQQSRICGSRMTFRDVSERFAKDLELQRSRALLEAVVHAQSAFIRDLEPGPLFQGLLDQLTSTSGADGAFLAELVTGPRKQLQLLASTADAEAMYDAGRVAVFETVESLAPARHHDASGHFLALPLHAAGSIIGIACLVRDSHEFDSELPAALCPLLDTAGAVIHGRRTEIRRRETEQRLDLALRATEMAIIDADLVRREVTVITSDDGFFGHGGPVRTLPFETWDGYFHDEDRPIIAAAFEAHVVQAPTPSLELQVRFRASNGSWRWVQFRGAAIEPGPSGNMTRLAGTLLDITSRKAAGEAGQLLEAEARELQQDAA